MSAGLLDAGLNVARLKSGEDGPKVSTIYSAASVVPVRHVVQEAREPDGLGPHPRHRELWPVRDSRPHHGDLVDAEDPLEVREDLLEMSRGDVVQARKVEELQEHDERACRRRWYLP